MNEHSQIRPIEYEINLKMNLIKLYVKVLSNQNIIFWSNEINMDIYWENAQFL